MPLAAVDWTNVLIAFIAGVPAIISAVGVLLVHGGCPRGADAIAAAYAARTRATRSRRTPRTGAGTGELRGTAATPK